MKKISTRSDLHKNKTIDEVTESPNWTCHPFVLALVLNKQQWRHWWHHRPCNIVLPISITPYGVDRPPPLSTRQVGQPVARVCVFARVNPAPPPSYGRPPAPQQQLQTMKIYQPPATQQSATTRETNRMRGSSSIALILLLPPPSYGQPSAPQQQQQTIKIKQPPAT